MAAEIIALRESMKRMTETFVPITGENDPRAEWALRAMRGIMIENRFLAAIVYPIPDGQGGSMLRYGGAREVVDMLIGDRNAAATSCSPVLDGLQKQATEYRALYLDRYKVSASSAIWSGSALRSRSIPWRKDT